MPKEIRGPSTYACKTCKAEYEFLYEAADCEKLPIEDREFRVGEMVSPLIYYHCRHWNCRYRPTSHGYKATVVISKILPVEPPGDEHWVHTDVPPEKQNHWNSHHHYLYAVKSICKGCGSKRSEAWYGFQLEHVRSAKKPKRRASLPGAPPKP